MSIRKLIRGTNAFADLQLRRASAEVKKREYLFSDEGKAASKEDRKEKIRQIRRDQGLSNK